MSSIKIKAPFMESKQFKSILFLSFLIPSNVPDLVENIENNLIRLEKKR